MVVWMVRIVEVDAEVVLYVEPGHEDLWKGWIEIGHKKATTATIVAIVHYSQ